MTTRRNHYFVGVLAVAALWLVACQSAPADDDTETTNDTSTEVDTDTDTETADPPINPSYDTFIARYNSDGTLDWAKSAGSWGWDGGTAIATLADGSLIATGVFQGEVTFGAGESNETTLHGFLDWDIYIVKLDAAGNLVWAKAILGYSANQPVGVSPLEDGTFFITGFFAGTAVFGAKEPEEIEITSTDDFDLFIAKYDDDGSPLWARAAGGVGFDAGFSVDVLPDGSAIAVGQLAGSAVIGEGEPGETALESEGDTDALIIKFDADGSVVWATSAGGEYAEQARDVIVLDDGSFITVGHFTATATFDSGGANQTELVSAGLQDAFVAKYDPDGALLWVTSIGSTDTEWGWAVDTTTDGSAIVTGHFSETATFGAGQENETAITSAGSKDIYTVKYDPDGTLLWVSTAGGTDYDEGKNAAVLADGSAIVTGKFTGEITLGEGESNETALVSSGELDVFTAKYNPDGTLAWAVSGGGPGEEATWGLSAYSDGASVITGYFLETATSGAGESNETILVNVD